MMSAPPFTPPLQRSPSPPISRRIDAAPRAAASRATARNFSHTAEEALAIRPRTPQERTGIKRPPLTKPTPRPARPEIIDIRFKEVTHYLSLAQITRDAPNEFTRALEAKKRKLKIGHLLHIDAKHRDPLPFSVILDWFDGKEILPLSKSQLVMLTGRTDAADQAYSALQKESEAYGLLKLSAELRKYVKPEAEVTDYHVEEGPRCFFSLYQVEGLAAMAIDEEDIEQIIRSHKPGKSPYIGLPVMRMVIVDAAIKYTLSSH